MRRSRFLSFVAAVFALVTPGGCKDKEAYRPSGVKFHGIGRPDFGPVTTDLRPPEPEVAGPEGPVRPLAVIISPDESLLVEAAPAGRNLSVRRVKGLVRVLGDGSVRTLLVRSTSPARKTPSGRDHVFASVVLAHEGRQSDPLPELAEGRPDPSAAAKADPELAAEFWHNERLSLVGVHDATATFLVSVDGFQGGAHPYASRSLVSVDLEAGKAVDFLPRFRGRDLVREVLGPGAAGECVRHLSGVAPVEAQSGAVAWVAALTHEFESCAGAVRLARVEPPASVPAGLSPAELKDGVLSLADGGLRVPGVVDFRASPSGDIVVMVMALGRDDRVQPPWSRKAADTRTRELRLWTRGMNSPAVIGRVPWVESVQFLSGHPSPERVLAAFAGL